MKTEKKAFDEYWEEVGRYLGVKDTITMENNDEMEDIIIFKNSCGCTLSEYNVDKGEVTYY